jgi:hypothetical protein
MRKILSLLTVVIIFSIIGLADEVPPQSTPKPDSKKSIDSFLNIRFDKNTKEAKLVIPKSQLKQLRAELEDLDNEQNTNAATTGFSRTQTVVGGLFMSLAFLFGGVWITRSRKIDTKSGKSLIVGAVLCCTGSLSIIALGNAGPPAELRQITGKLFDKKVFGYWKSAGGPVKVQVSDTAQYPELIVPDVPDEKKTSDQE